MTMCLSTQISVYHLQYLNLTQLSVMSCHVKYIGDQRQKIFRYTDYYQVAVKECACQYIELNFAASPEQTIPASR